MSVTGPITYYVRENWNGAVLIWQYPDSSGGSCQFPSPAAARRYAVEAEGHRLEWSRSGSPGSRRWETTTKEER